MSAEEIKSGKWKPYPSYKNSGVEWLGEVPEGWGVLPVKYLVQTPVTDGPHETPNLVDEGGIPFVSAEAISFGKIDFEKIRGYISIEDHKTYSKKYKPRRGDLYMVKSGATTGRVAMVETEQKFSIWSPLAAIRCNAQLAFNYFLYYYLQSQEFQTGVELGWSFGTQQNIGMGVIENLSVPLPSISEQEHIANFLDLKTGEIDALIAKKKELIAKLIEKRSALISRTVTKGLPPEEARKHGLPINPKMKDSGVEWLGEVPEGWGVERLKYSSLCKVSNVDKKTKEDEQNVRLCNYTDVYYNDYITSRQDFMKATAKPEEISRFCLLNNDVVITKDSEDWRDIAVPALVTETSPDIICGYHLAIIRPNSHRLLGVFLFRLMQSHAVNQQFQIASSGVTRFGLPKSSIGEAIIPVPSIPEQQAIANFLDLETGNIDLVVSKIREAISKLTDYRAALITAAVTGKIDVR